MSYNRVILMGNITRDIECRTVGSGTQIATFGIAMNRKFKTGDGQMKEEVCFVDCTAWGKTGENIARFFAKGKPILLEGRLHLEQWDDKTTGQKRSKLGVVVDSFQFCGGKDDAPRAATSAPAPAPAKRPTQAVPQIAEEDIPF